MRLACSSERCPSGTYVRSTYSVLRTYLPPNPTVQPRRKRARWVAPQTRARQGPALGLSAVARRRTATAGQCPDPRRAPQLPQPGISAGSPAPLPTSAASAAGPPPLPASRPPRTRALSGVARTLPTGQGSKSAGAEYSVHMGTYTRSLGMAPPPAPAPATAGA